MDIKALQLESRFSLPPNSLGYCGQDTAPERFKKCIRDGNCKDVEKEITKFIVLHPYLKTLAKITSLPIFSYPIIEAYWLGNDELKKAEDKDYDLLLDSFLEQEVPDFFVATLREKRPNKFIPSHFFQVLHVGVGQASGAVPFNLDSINNCMIRWGKVVRVKDQSLKINLTSLKIIDKQYRLYKKEETIPVNTSLVPGINEGDIVAVHWNMVIKRLTENEAEKLDYWTRQVLNSLYS